MKTATLDDLKTWGLCWLNDKGYEDRVKTLAGRRKRWRLAHVLALRGRLSDADWQWLIHTYLDRMGYKRELRLAACYYATRALNRERKAGREPDKRSWAAIRVAKRHASGKATDEQLAAAGAAARSAAGDAAGAAAGDAAGAAAGDAARAAARDAARAAARSAELKAQCDWLVRFLKRVARTTQENAAHR